MKLIAPVSVASLGATMVLALVLASTEASTTADASEPGGMDSMSIDMNPHGTPANTATSIGSREFCARINENDLLDADEDDIDTLEIDVTTGPVGIPESNPLIAFEFAIRYAAADLIIVNRDIDFLLSAAPGSDLFDLSDPIPDEDGRLYVGAIDLNVERLESGPGTLARLKTQTTDGAEPGIKHLMFDSPTTY
ncbi:MAG: hypothetical protein ACE5FA_08190, partial [Dehalococcoidia bacterium]